MTEWYYYDFNSEAWVFDDITSDYSVSCVFLIPDRTRPTMMRNLR